jgi:proteasome lid subunit RPN8/RPN11
MIVAIASGVAESLLDAAAAAAPVEACGLLLGQPDRIVAAIAARNVAADPERGFEIDPALLLRTHREARGAGLQVIGHYHSHPNGVATPSRRDAAAALDNGQLWLIVAAGAVKAFRAVSGATENMIHGRFEPVTLVAA